MLNGDVSRQTAAESMSQVTSYFQAVDNAVLMGDTNKRYRPSTNGCYGPSVPVHALSYTNLVISPSFDNTADLYNSYIYAELTLDFNIDFNDPAVNIPKWNPPDQYARLSSPYRTWVGFKDAMDAVEKYEIVSNGITKYTQNYAPEESYITNCACLDSIRKGDVYSKARHKDIFSNRYQDKCGCVLDWGIDGTNMTSSATVTATGKRSKTVTIKLKIDIRRFLPLSNIKYLPAFAGKIELHIQFGTAGLVWCPIDSIESWKTESPPLYWSNVASDAIVNEFRPIGAREPTMAIVGATLPDVTAAGKVNSGGVLTAAEIIVGVVPSSLEIRRLDSVIYCFGIADALYQGLKQRYTSMTLTFPTQILNITSMSNILSTETSKSSQTITPRFIDTIFLLFPLNGNYRTVFKNPGFRSFSLTCGGFGQYPDIQYGTVNEPRLVEMVQNALNLNNNTVAPNEEVLNSLMDDWNSMSPGIGWVSDDRTSFLIAIPMETDGTFQQGMTSATPINFELIVNHDALVGQGYARKTDRPPLICLLQDATISIQVMADGSPALVEVGPFDITSPVSG